MPIHTPDGYLDITNATLRASEITTTSKVGIANSAPTHTLSVGNKLFVDDSASNVLTVSGNLVASTLKLGHIDLTPSYGLEHVANVINTISNVVQFTNTTTGFVSVSNVGIGTSTSPAGLLDVVGAFRMRYQDMGLTKAHIISGANSTSLNEDAGTYTYTRGAATTTGYFLPNPTNITPKVGQRYRVKLTARSDYAGTIRYECPTSTIITTYDLTTSFKEYTWDFNAEGTTMQFAVTTPLGSTTQFNAFSIERLGVGFNVNPTSTIAPLEISGVTHFSDNVGIGTNNPFGKLQVDIADASAATATWDATKVVFGDIANGNSQGLGFGVSTNSHASIISLAPGVAWRGLGYYSAWHKWYINDVEKMVLDASGNVGIGTASPTTPLHVYKSGDWGSATVESSGAVPAQLQLKNSSGYFTLRCDANSADLLFLNGTGGSGPVFKQNGNVGIGTASPGSLLTIESTTGNQLRLNYNADWYSIIERDSVGDLNFLEKRGASASLVNLMTIKSGGNVGVGTDNPATKLHYYDASAVPVFTIESATSGHANYTKYRNPNNAADVYVGMDGSGLFGLSMGSLALGTGNSPIIFAPNYSSGEKMRITSSGNVGIGTNNPVRKFMLGIGSGQLAGYLDTYHQSGVVAGMVLGVKQHGGVEKDTMYISDSGLVGIGTNRPLAPLDIPISANGTIDVNDYQDGYYWTWDQSSGHWLNDYYNGANVAINADGGGVIGHVFWAGYSIQFLSDRRIKKDIREIDDESALEQFRLLKPSKYKYIEPMLSGRTDKEVYGFIAQEVAEVLPEGVTIGGLTEDGTNQGHIPNIMSMCSVESQNISSDAYENLGTEQKGEYIETGNTYTRHVVTITKTIDPTTFNIGDSAISYKFKEQTKTTGAFDKNSDDKYHPLVFYGKDLKTVRTNVVRVIDDSSFVVDEKLDLNKYKDDEVLLYGQRPDDFYRLNKDAIFTLASAALQEVDRQLQAEKTKTSTFETELQAEKTKTATLETKTVTLETKTTALETKLQEAEAKTATLETKTTTLETELQAEKTKTTTLETKTTTLETELQAEKVKTTALETKLQEAEDKIATLQAEKGAIRSDLSSLVLRVVALES